MSTHDNMCESQNLNFELLKEIAGDFSSKQKLGEIAKDHWLVFNRNEIIRGEQIFPVVLGNLKLFFRKNSAYSSIEVYHEIFVKNKHMRLHQFRKIAENGIILDIGACEGFYTMKIKENNPTARIISVEPNYLVFDLLEKNISENNLKNITCINKAIYSTHGFIDLEIVREIPSITSTRINKSWLDKNRIQTINCEAVTLAQIFYDFDLNRVDLLKIDTEGGELEILKGASDILSRIHKIVIEYHSDELKQEVISILKNCGFVLLFDDDKIYGDLYFIQE